MGLIRWYTRGGAFGERSGRAPAEVLVLRTIGLAYLVAFVFATVTTNPRPSLHGRGLLVTLATAVFTIAIVARMPRPPASSRAWVLTVVAIVASSGVLAATQSAGLWAASPYFVAVFAALRLDRRQAALLVVASIVAVDVGALIGHHSGAISATVGAIPWFLIVRLLRESRDRQNALERSRVAEARAAAAAERGRLAREIAARAVSRSPSPSRAASAPARPGGHDHRSGRRRRHRRARGEVGRKRAVDGAGRSWASTTLLVPASLAASTTAGSRSRASTSTPCR